MSLATLLNYEEIFCNLRTNYTHEHNQSPHKFVLLLSLIMLFDMGYLHGSRIQCSDDLWETWQSVFCDEWEKWVRNQHHKMNFAMPLYHLRHELFWQFYLYDNKATVLNRSLKNLRESIDYIELDTELAQLLMQPATRQILKDVLLARLLEIA